jgi:hypothetical protein
MAKDLIAMVDGKRQRTDRAYSGAMAAFLRQQNVGVMVRATTTVPQIIRIRATRAHK